MAELNEKIDLLQRNLFIDSPGDVLVKVIAEQLNLVTQFKAVFGSFIDPYRRMDYQMSNLPALRIYNNIYEKPDEDWFINGDIVLDCIFPANIRRTETQALQDIITAALLQQFRRPKFFNAVADSVPGLNELGRRFSVDKSLGFEWDENEVPLTQMIINFRLDLRQWDDYLESTNRTKDDPFEETLATLTKIINTVQGLRDDNVTVEVTEVQNTTIGD